MTEATAMTDSQPPAGGAPQRLHDGRWAVEVAIANENGLHARPALLVAQLAGKFACEVNVHKGNQQADGKSVLQLMTLAAELGTPLRLEARGADAPQALAELARLFAAGFHEGDAAAR